MWGQSQDGDSWEPQGPSVGPGQRGTWPLTAHRTEEGEAFMISNGRGSGQRSLMRTAQNIPLSSRGAAFSFVLEPFSSPPQTT